MRRLGPALVLTWAVPTLLQTSGVEGQVPRSGCLKPGPYSVEQRVMASPGVPAAEGAQAHPRFYLSRSGELCRSLPPRSEEGRGGQVASDRGPEPGKAFLFSAVLPGAGQWYLGKNRWPAYLAVEAWAWIQFLDWRRAGRKLQRQYKDLAWFVARRVSTGFRTDAGWDYYEALTHFKASGAYDSDPLSSGVQPEEDPATFNGSIWALAQEIYLPGNPDTPPEEGSEALQKAHDYYLSRAYTPNLAWDWGSNTLHQDEYGTLIREADEALRSSTGMIGVILANHLLSAVDALVSGRLGIVGEVDPSVEVLLVPGPFSTRDFVLQLRFPNPLTHVH